MTDAQPTALKATFKLAAGYDAPWLVIDAHSTTHLKEIMEDVNQQGIAAYMGNLAKSFHAAYNVATILGPVTIESGPPEPPHPAQQAAVAFDKAMAATAPAPVAPAVTPPAPAVINPDPWAAPVVAAPSAAWPPAPAAAAPAAAAPAAPAGWPAPPTAAASPAATGWGAVTTPVADTGSTWGAAPGAPAVPAATGVPQVASFGPARVKQDVAKTGPNAGQPYTRYEDPRPWASIKDFIKTDNPNDPGLLAGTHRFEVYA